MQLPLFVVPVSFAAIAGLATVAAFANSASACQSLPGSTEGAAAAPKLPALGAPVRIEAGGKPIAVDHAAPCVLDFDGDGCKDLLVGQFDGGTCRVYLNSGRNDAPAFGTFELLKAGGRPATMRPG